MSKYILSPLFCILLFSCSVTRSYYSPEVDVACTSKKTEPALLLPSPPQGLVYRIGVVSVNGNGFSNHSDVIDKARQKASEVGGDFIVRENFGTESSTFYTPGHSTYQSNSSFNVQGQGNINSYQINGYGSQQAYGYSVGPSVDTYYFPWANFSVWAKVPCHLGIELSEIYIVGIYPNTDASASGIEVGDQLYAINGYQIYDRELIKHLFAVQPGDNVILTIQRKGQRFDCTVTALPPVPPKVIKG